MLLTVSSEIQRLKVTIFKKRLHLWGDNELRTCLLLSQNNSINITCTLRRKKICLHQIHCQLQGSDSRLLTGFNMKWKDESQENRNYEYTNSDIDADSKETSADEAWLKNYRQL